MKTCCSFHWGIAKINFIIYNRYGEKMSEKIIKGIIKLVLIFPGTELEYIGEVRGKHGI